MSTQWIAWIILLSPPSSVPANRAEGSRPAAETSVVMSADQFQATYKKIYLATAKHRYPKPQDHVRALVGLYQQLEHVKGLSDIEHRKIRFGLLLRLMQMHQQLQINRRNALYKQQRMANPNTANPLAGGGAFNTGDELIDLIQTTVAPDTWDINGGPGAIRYFRPLNALVIRAPGSTHHEVGEMLEQLRRLQN